jgi:DNA-binding transcriptional MerR regulator
MVNQPTRKKRHNKVTVELPTIPDKLYFGIGEVAKLCDIKAHVLRYWEEEFELLKPAKRRGNRRFYQRKDVLLVRQIRDLLYIQGFTIEGAKAQLAANQKEPAKSSVSLLKELLKSLEDVLITLK